MKAAHVLWLIPLLAGFSTLAVAAVDCTFVERPDVRKLFDEWLECENCTDVRLKDVIGNEALIPCFEEILVAVEAKLNAHYRAALVQAYRETEAYYAEHPEQAVASVRMSEEEYVAGELANRMTRLKARAVMALGAYQTDATKSALDSTEDRLRGSATTSDRLMLEFIDQVRKSSR